MVAITTSKKQQLRDDRKTAKKLKPHLRKYVINTQVQQAAETTKHQFSQVDKIKQIERQFRDAVTRAKMLSLMCFDRDKLWLPYPPAVQMKWLFAIGTSDELENERVLDLWGFARYLVKEYFGNYQTEQGNTLGYRNPLDEQNLPFFWQKFNADLRLLIEADKRRIAKGNEGAVLVKPN